MLQKRVSCCRPLVHQIHQFLGHVEMLGGEHFPQVHADEPASGDVQDFHHPGVGKDDAMVLIRHQEPFLGQLGEEIKLLFRFHHGGDIPHRLEPADDPALGVGDDGGGDRHRNLPAVPGPDHPPQPGNGFFMLHDLLEHAIAGVALGGVEQFPASHPAHHLAAGVAGEFLHVVVEVGDHQKRVHHEKGQGEIFQDAGQGGHLLFHHRVGQQVRMLPDEDETAGLLVVGAPDGSGGEGEGGADGPARLQQHGDLLVALPQLGARAQPGRILPGPGHDGVFRTEGTRVSQMQGLPKEFLGRRS